MPERFSMKITFLEEPPFIIGKQRGPFISFLLPMHQNWHRHLIKSRDGGLCIAASISFQNVLNILLRVWHNVMFRNKRSQAKGVYYVFLYKQHMDNVYTRVAIHRFTIGSLVVGQSSSSPPQSWISTLAREYWANLTLWLRDAEPIGHPVTLYLL